MQKRFYPILLFAFLCFACQCAGQAATPLHFSALTINEGLSQGFISGIVQDKQGIMWFGTSDGLNKYDGYSFTVYHHDADDSTSIASDDITYVFEDSKQRMWVCTRNNGLDMFDREQNVFYHFRRGDKNSLRSDKMSTISEDKYGALLVVSEEEGIDRLEILNEDFPNQKKVRFTHLDFRAGNPAKTLRGSVFTDSRGHTYFSTSTAIYEVFFKSYNDYRLEEKTKVDVRSADFVPAMLEDTGSYSLFFNGENVIRYPGYDFNLPHIVHNHKDLKQSPVWTIDKQQMIWVMENNGLVRIDIPTGEKWYYTSADSAQQVALNTTTGIYADKQGIVWIGTGGYGVLKYDPEIERFHHILPGTKHYQILEIKPGEIITNNFKKIAFGKNLTSSLQDDALTQLIRAKFLHSNIMYFSKDTSGNLWIPYGSEIYFYNLRTKEQRTYKISFDDVGRQIYPIYADNANKLWMGMEEYFVGFKPLQNTMIKTRYPVSRSFYETEFLQSIFADGKVLWLGSASGLFKFDTATQKIIQSYFLQPKDSSSLSNDFVYCFCNDVNEPERYLWIGTKGGGLNRLNKLTGKFTRYTSKQGLANNVVYGILPGDDGNLWLSTNKGLSAFNPTTKAFRNYDVNDGLQSNEFNRFAYCKTSDGILVFGGMNGLNYFDPTTIQPLQPPDVIFTDFRLFNKPVNPRDPQSPIKKSINYEKEITLKYEQNVITFQFAAMDYRRSGNIVYRYKMEGFDKDWIPGGTKHEATYTNLDPGEYDFIVQASFESGFWAEKKKSIHISIVSPWYRTWWFYVSTTVTVLSMIYGLYLFRLNQRLRMETLRNRIARDLHDEVGSSISTISIYSKIMHEQVGAIDFDNEPLIKKINDFASEIMESMNDIVWNINTKNDAFDRIVSRMREHALQLLEAKNYDVHFDFDESLNRLKLTMEKRREFYLIYKEALNNIAKYAEGKNVWIALKLQHNTIKLTIKDDGKGFEITNARSGGNGLTNMRHRATTLNSKLAINAAPQQGTEIQLIFNAG